MVCTPCKTSYNVLSHSHIMIWGLVQFVSGGGGGVGSIGIQVDSAKERISRFLDLKRLASLGQVCALSVTMQFFGHVTWIPYHLLKAAPRMIII